MGTSIRELELAENYVEIQRRSSWQRAWQEYLDYCRGDNENPENDDFVNEN